MGIWDEYTERINAHGGTKRGVALARAKRSITNHLPDSLSYHDVVIEGTERYLAVISSDDLNIKTICSVPGESFSCGDMIEYEDEHWLVTSKDATKELYEKGIMSRCNYLLRWVDDGEIVERWCIVYDGTKYLIGEDQDRDMVVVRGDSRIQMTIARDERTLKFTRKSRFIIDDYGLSDGSSVLAYRLTKPFRLGGVYNEHGVFNFLLTECNSEETDDLVQHIPNYFLHFPPDGAIEPIEPGTLLEGQMLGCIDPNTLNTMGNSMSSYETPARRRWI